MKNKTILVYTSIILSILVLSCIIGFVIYSFWKKSGIDDDKGYNSINAVIALLSLAFSIITVIFVYATYQSSLKQINDNNKNVGLDRALDNIYRQLEFTRQNYSEKLDVYANIQSKLDGSQESLFYNLHGSRRFLDYYASELELYIWIVEKPELSWEDKSFLLNIVFKNYSEIIKRLYHKLYTIKVCTHDKNIFDNIIVFFTNHYSKQKSDIDPNFASLSCTERERIIKDEMKDEILNKFFTLQIVYEKLDWIKKIENDYRIIRPNVLYPK
ncbi:hypothetical protein [Sphingobacterium sp. UBA6320]|uniref:hypothetical protein n=1 Tax=Sphingobacterium sp. UBA6320 TaxID=1947510 RepID=UPI0025CD8499|nr:hypothetical protein [Sphingobacterium sp. UBA6320]